MRRRCLGLLRLGYPSAQVAEQMGCSERTLRRWVALAREEVAADYVIRDGDGVVGNRAEIDGLLRANLQEIERLRERQLSTRETLAILRERRAVAESLMRLTGSAELMQ